MKPSTAKDSALGANGALPASHLGVESADGLVLFASILRAQAPVAEGEFGATGAETAMTTGSDIPVLAIAAALAETADETASHAIVQPARHETSSAERAETAAGAAPVAGLADQSLGLAEEVQTQVLALDGSRLVSAVQPAAGVNLVADPGPARRVITDAGPLPQTTFAAEDGAAQSAAFERTGFLQPPEQTSAQSNQGLLAGQSPPRRMGALPSSVLPSVAHSSRLHNPPARVENRPVTDGGDQLTARVEGQLRQLFPAGQMSAAASPPAPAIDLHPSNVPAPIAEAGSATRQQADGVTSIAARETTAVAARETTAVAAPVVTSIAVMAVTSGAAPIEPITRPNRILPVGGTTEAAFVQRRELLNDRITGRGVAIHSGTFSSAASLTPGLPVDTLLPPAGADPLSAEFRHTLSASAQPGAVETPLREAQVRAQLVAQMNWMRDGGINRAVLQLHPAELGAVRVQLDTSGETINVSIFANQALTRDSIEQSLHRLRDQLESQGFASINIDVGGDKDFAQADSDTHDFHEGSDDNLLQQPTVVPSAHAHRHTIGTGLVDLFA